jgi:hypothetical protein
MSGTPLEMLFGGGNPQTAQNMMTQRFMPGGGGGQQGGTGIQPSQPGAQMPTGYPAGGGMQMPGPTQGGANPQNFLDQRNGFGGQSQGGGQYAPSPPPMSGGGNPFTNFIRGAAGQSVESGSDRSMRNWQNQEAYKSAYREWQSQDQEWQEKKKAYDTGQTELTMAGKGKLVEGSSAPDYADVQTLVKANPELKDHPELIIGALALYGKAGASEEKAHIAELAHQDRVARQNEIDQNDDRKDKLAQRKADDTRNRNTDLNIASMARIGQTDLRQANAKTKAEADIAIRDRETEIKAINARRIAVEKDPSLDEGTRAHILSEIETSLLSIEQKAAQQGQQPQQQPQQQAAPAQPAVPTVASDDDFHNLPSGTEFIDPEGNRRKKP